MRLPLVTFALSTLLLASVRGLAEAKWTVPTPAELSMTSEPRAPGAPAIILSYEETADAESAEVTFHVRIKILTIGGLSAANIDLPDRIVTNDDTDQQISARTIHSNGTIIPFTGTPQNSIVKDDGEESHRILALSGAEVGSILEYFCHFRSVNTLMTHLVGYYSPVWQVQRNYFIREAHFNLRTPDDFESKDVRWVANLPRNVAPRYVKKHVLLDLTDVPAAPDEDFAPPRATALYNVRFFYYDDTRDKFWGTVGDKVDTAWFNFYTPRKALVTVVNGLIQPSDTDEQKLSKIYTAVMQFENTDYTRRRSEAEDKKNGFGEAKNSEDIWNRKRGDSDDLTLLFIALARSAGYPASPMAVTSRNLGVFDQDVLSWSQMDSMLAIVNVKGREVFFDSGTRYCPFAHVAPWHSNVIGVSSEGKLIKIRYTPKESSASSHIDRVVNLKLTEGGTISGTVKLSWTGTAGLALRENALRTDKSAVETGLLKDTQAEVPPGIDLKLVSLDGLNNGEVPLVATFSATGTLGTSTRTRLVLPEQFFESTAKQMLDASTRTLPVNFPQAYSKRDLMTIQVPAGYTVESLPPSQSLALQSDTMYKTAIQAALVQGDDPKQPPVPTLIVQRIFVMNRIDYKAEEYSGLHTYFGEIATHDQEQILLHTKPTQSAAN
jgi:hypothetical protein